jgi:hypothetical protein
VTKKTAAKQADTAAAASLSKKTAAKKVAAKAPAETKPASKPVSKPISKKAVSKKAVAKKTTPTAAATRLADRPVTLAPVANVSPEERYRMIADAAYYRAERRNFEPGHEHEDWLAAEAEVEELLGQRRGR